MGFVRMNDAELIGLTLMPAGTIVSVNDARADKLASKGAGVRLDSIEVRNLDGIAEGNAAFAARIPLAGAAVTLNTTDLTTVTGGAGTTNFSAIHAILLRNRGTGTKVLIFGNAAATQFIGFTGAAAHTIKIPAGCELLLRTKAAAGIATAGAFSIKLDPGVDTFDIDIAIKGNAA